ncbi:MAG: cupin domain-containing protein [Burkholderiales bacterium]|nr:cupin domain-containing protein [Burkholderiales bacterium]
MFMKKLALSAFVVALCTPMAQADTGAAQTLFKAAPQNVAKGSADVFTGDVQVNRLFPANDTAHYSGAYVTFAPGARSAWHEHPAGQHIVVTQGTALTGTRDGKVTRVETGDSVWCPPGVEHWHGATPDAPMTHLVITGVRDGKNAVWKEHVTDAQYRGQP